MTHAGARPFPYLFAGTVPTAWIDWLKRRFSARSRVPRACADSGSAREEGCTQASLRNVRSAVTATLRRTRHASGRTHDQFRRGRNPHRHAGRERALRLPIRRFDQFAQQRDRETGDFDGRYGDRRQRGPRLARELNIGNADHGQIARHVQAEIRRGMHCAERRQIVGREDRGECRIGFQQLARRGVAALDRIGRMLDPAFRHTGPRSASINP